MVVTNGLHEFVGAFGVNHRTLLSEFQLPNISTGALAPYRSSVWNTIFLSLGFCAFVIPCLIWGMSSSDWTEVIISENGPMERVSAAIWFMGFVWCLAAACTQPVRAVEWLGIAMFLLLFGLRELDAHRWSTGWNLDKLANYWNPHIPFFERMLVLGLMVLPCLTVGLMLCRRWWKSIGLAWNAGESWLRHLVFVVVLLVLCLTLDKVGPYVLPFFGIGETGQNLAMGIEEILEVWLAVFTMASLWPFLQEALKCHE